VNSVSVIPVITVITEQVALTVYISQETLYSSWALGKADVKVDGFGQN